MRYRAAALAVVACSWACAPGPRASKPGAPAAPASIETTSCSAELEPLRRYVAITSMSDVFERDGRPQRTVVAREMLALPVFITPTADAIDVRWQVSPDFEEVLSVEAGVVVRNEPVDDLVPADASWVFADAGKGRLDGLRDVDALARNVLPAAARLAQSGQPQPLEALQCALPSEAAAVDHYHRWPVWIHGELNGQPISERIEVQFQTAAAFAPGGTAASFEWTRDGYQLQVTAWLAASYEPGWRTDAELRVRAVDSEGNRFDGSQGGVASAAPFPGSEQLGLGNIELGSFPSARNEGDAQFRSLVDWAGTCRSSAGCPPGQPCERGHCVVSRTAERGDDRCVLSGDRITCQCADGHEVERWQGLGGASSRDLQLVQALSYTCSLGSTIALEGNGPPIALTFGRVIAIAHEG